MTAGAASRPRTRVPGPAAVTGYLFLAAGLGALSGLVWWLVTDLPAYTVNPDGTAAAGERSLAAFVSADAWFAVIGVVAGAVLGVLGWRLLGDLGWPVVLLGVTAAFGASLLCWSVGYQLGPGDLPPRLAAAQAGDQVPIELTLRAKAGLAVWPFAAALPLLLGSSLGPEAEDEGR